MAARYCLNITFLVFSTTISNILWSIKTTFKVSNCTHFKHKLLHKYLSDILLGLPYCVKVENEIKFNFGVNCNILYVDTKKLIFLDTTQSHSRNIFNTVKKVWTLKGKIKLRKLEENLSPLTFVSSKISHHIILQELNTPWSSVEPTSETSGTLFYNGRELNCERLVWILTVLRSFYDSIDDILSFKIYYRE
jgi:hypothetical protein